MDGLGKFLRFLERLDSARLAHTLGHFRDSINVLTTANGNERWEVEFFEDGHVEVEVFRSGQSGIEDESALERLFGQ